MGDDDDTATREQQHAGWRARTSNMEPMFVTELTSQLPMGLLKAWAFYSTARDGRPCGVSSDLGAGGWGTDDDEDTATREQQQHAR